MEPTFTDGRVSPSRVGKSALFWMLQCAGWAAFGAVMLAWGLEHWHAADALANKLVLVGTGFLLTLAYRSLYRRSGVRRLPPAGFAALVGALSFGGAALWIEAHYLLLAAGYAVVAGVHLATVRPVAIEIGALLYHGFVLLAWSLLYLAINAWLELAEQRRRTERAEALMHEARLRALQSQLEPHFLFNTLNAISTLVVEGRNAAAAWMISRLADFLRLTLDTADVPEISVAEELEFVRYYLEIEQVRFGDRLCVTVEASPDALCGLVPVLLLQPLVENAVKHGVLPRESGGRVAVSIARRDGVLRISVTDDGPGLAADPALRRRVGLGNTAARLAALYGDGSVLRLDAAPGGGLMAIVEIPFRCAPPRLDEAAPAPARGGGR